jgi:hypothetical protein
MCIFKIDIEVEVSGQNCDTSQNDVLKSNHSKLHYIMRMLGISKHNGHWTYRQCQVTEKRKVLHILQHSVYVVEYGEDYLEVEALPHVENCIPCLLHCKKHVIDKVIHMFFIGAQESILCKSKAE